MTPHTARNQRRLVLSLLALALVALVGRELAGRGTSARQSISKRSNANLLKLPISFEPNRGQSDSCVKFLSHGPGYALFLTPDEVVLSLSQATAADIARGSRRIAVAHSVKKSANERLSNGAILRIKLAGANPKPSIQGVDPLGGHVNYFIGSQTSKWQRNLPTYGRVAYRDIYPGIDQIYYGGSQDRLEYDFVVAPGADPNDIRMRFDGETGLRIDRNGNLAIALANGTLLQHAPVIYQERDGHRERVFGKCVVASRDTIGFKVASFDHSRPLIIDPGLVYSSYLGGSTNDFGFAIAVDGAGNAYIAGAASSSNFPVTTGAFQPALGGIRNAFVTKVNADGSGLAYSTYLGGSNFDAGGGIAVDTAGDAYVTGVTSSANFPVTSGAYQTALSGVVNAFVAKVQPDGSGLIYSTYLGHDATSEGSAIAIDSSGSAYITGLTNSSTFPVTTGAFQQTLGGFSNAFVTKMTPDGSGLVYSTFLGGSLFDSGAGVAVDGAGDAYVTGETSSANFPTTAGVFQTALGGPNAGNAFVTKVTADGSSLAYSSFLGGSLFDSGAGVAVDASGDAYVTGETSSSNFPITKSAFQSTIPGQISAFVTKVAPDGSSLAYSTYVGGNGNSQGQGIAIDSSGDTYVTGGTSSTNFPVTPGAFQTTLGGSGGNAFLTKLDADGSNLDYSTYMGGSGNSQGAMADGDGGKGVAVDSAGNAYVTGITTSANFPVTTGAFQTTAGGTGSFFNAFVAKFDLTGASPVPTPTPTSTVTPTPTATPTPSGTISVSKTSLTIKAEVGKTKTKTVTIKNTGETNVRGEVSDSLTAPYAITSGAGGFDLADGDKQKVKISFAPTATGTAVSQSFMIVDSSTNLPVVTVTITGIGK